MWLFLESHFELLMTGASFPSILKINQENILTPADFTMSLGTLIWNCQLNWRRSNRPIFLILNRQNARKRRLRVYNCAFSMNTFGSCVNTWQNRMGYTFASELCFFSTRDLDFRVPPHTGSNDFSPQPKPPGPPVHSDAVHMPIYQALL